MGGGSRFAGLALGRGLTLCQADGCAGRSLPDCRLREAQPQLTLAVGRLCCGGVYRQAVGMEEGAGSLRLVRSGRALGAAAQHSVQPTGEDLGRLTMLAAPAADGRRWALTSNLHPQGMTISRQT